MRLITLALLCSLTWSCSDSDAQVNLLTDVSPEVQGAWVQVVVEIPVGSTEKWEVNKHTGQIERDSINGQPRTINYLGYPGNYGFIPQTLLPKEAGGDGDPLDILVLGDVVERGTVLRCKIVGVLKLLDNGEQDDKLIAIAENSSLSKVNNLAELDSQYSGILEIIETWFSNYKGEDIMFSAGFEGPEKALDLLAIAIEAFN